MLHFMQNRKHFLISLISLVLISGFIWAAAPSVTYADTAVLTFTSDIHNSSNNTANNRLNRWLDNVQDQYGHIDAMSFCGDMGTASGGGDSWWGYVNTVMDTVASKRTENNEELPGVYTTGNHEFYNGSFGSESASSYQKEMEGRFIIGDVGREGDNYIIYCFGTDNWNNNMDNFTTAQISTLNDYLLGVGNDKPIIVLVHFPLHRWSSRYTRNAGMLIDVLNDAADRGQKIILLWGHNHSQADTNYDQIFEPGSVIEYQNGAAKTFNFLYAAAGCMSDTEYGNSASVKGKGLVLTIDANDKVTMSYLDADGNDVTEGGTYTEKDPVAVTDVSVSPTEAEIEVKRSVQLKATVDPEDATNKNVTWSSSDTSVATVSETGRVKGVGEGTATITATTKDGGKQASCTVTVIPRTTPDKPFVIASGGYALSTERSPNTASGSSSSYIYRGLSGVEFISGQAADDSIRWIFEETDGGYYIMSIDGRYLNATYVSRRGELMLSDTPDVWVLDDGYSIDDGIVDGSKLRSTNATQSSGSAKYLGYEESPANLFTVRSSGSADPVTITEAIDPVPVTGVSVDPGEASIEVRKNVQLTAAVEPEDATNKAVTWSSSDTQIARVDQNGKVRGVRAGTVTITATTKDGGMTADCTVTVTPSSTPDQFYVITINDYALSTEPSDDQVSVSSGSQRYYYNGLNGVEYPVEGDAPDNILWFLEETEGGYYIMSLDGQYLNATYGANSTGGNTGVLKLDDTPDVWTLDGTLDDWEISGSQLRSTNAGKYMTHEEYSGSTSGGQVNLFTVRSQGESSDLIDTTEHTLVKTDAVEATCTTAGNSAYWTCSDCGKYFSDENGQTRIKENGWAIDALRHDMTAHKAVAATCTEDGNSAYFSCGRCEKFYADANGEDEIAKNSWVIDALGHNMTAHEAVPATCTEDGNSAYFSCDRCEKYFSDADGGHEIEENSWVIDALGHDWDEGEVTTEPTCEADGEKLFTCQNDPSHTRTEKIEALGHDWDEGEVMTEPTCEADGEKTFTCQNDPSHTRTEKIAALGHDWDEGKVTTEPTCTADGEKTFTCQNDPSHTRTEKIEALGHNMTEHKAVSVTCEEDGNSAYFSCDRCGKFFSDAEGAHEIEENSWVIAATGHDWGEGRVVVQPGCTTTGLIRFTCRNNWTHTKNEVIPALGHNMTEHEAVPATCTEDGNSAYFSCDRCDKFYSDAEGGHEIEENSWVIDALGHDWDEGKVMTEATCEADGEKLFTCQNDPSHTRIEKIEALGHDWDEGTVTTEPTCTADGEKTFTCQNDPSHTRTEKIAALGHNMTEHAAVSATCEEAGNSAYYSCDRCEKFFSDAEGAHEIEENSWVIAATGHDWGEGRVITEPGCTTSGLMSFTCRKNWTHRKTEVIPALGHNMTEHEAAAATCTEDGNSAYFSCDRCEKFFSDAEGEHEIEESSWVIAALGHDWDEGEVTTEPTCEAAGEKTFTCQNDPSHIRTEKIEALGHDWDEGEVTTEPTCTTDGEKTFTCQNDPSHTRTEKIAAPGHDWDEGEVTTEPTCTTDGEKTFTCQNDPSHTRTEKIAAPGHNMTEHAAVSATCEEDGNSAYYSCDRCEKFFSDTDGAHEIEEDSWVIAATGHDWGEGRVIRQASCTTTGLMSFTCRNNWTHRKTEEIPALGHNMTEHEAAAATCTEDGNRAYFSCDRCGKFFSDAEGEHEIEENSWVIAAFGHDWDEGKVTKEATCEADGEKTFTCQNDPSHIRTEKIAALGHDWDEGGVTTEPTCTTDGEKTFICQNDPSHTRTEKIAAFGHNMTEHAEVSATCEGNGNSAYYSCDRCGKFFSDAEGANEIEEDSWVIAATGHNWRQGRVIRQASCTTTGLVSYICLNNWTHTKTEEIPALGHNMTEHEAVSATCEKAGNSAYFSCDRCEKYFSDAEGEHEIEENSLVIAAFGHDWDEGKITKEATCEADGEKTFTCQNDPAHTKTEKIPAPGHDMIAHEAVSATCEGNGNSAYYSCDRCEKYFSDAEGGHEIEKNSWVLAALGHDWDEGKVTKEATCTTGGEKTFTCQNDPSHTKTEKIPAPGHNMTAHEAVSATCEEAGNSAYFSCDRCEKYFSDAECEHEIEKNSWVIAALGHEWSEWKVTKPATEDEEGEEARTCSRCNKTETREIPKLNHEHAMKKVEAVAPTCTEDGNIEYWQCTKCKKYYSEEAGGAESELKEEDLVIKATGHTAVEDPEEKATCTEPGKTAGSHCSVCGEVIVSRQTIPATGHKWDEGKVTTEPTCTEAGEKTFTCQNDPSHTRTEAVAELGHDWSEWEVTKPATEEEGEETRTCSRCNKTETREIPKLNHEHSMTKVEAVAPTCTEDGNIEYWYCAKCKRYYSEAAGGAESELNEEELVIKATGHTVVEDPEEKPTCTESGKTAGSHCSICGEVIESQQRISALGHDWSEWVVTKPATEEEEGEEARTCSQCGKTETREVPKLDPTDQMGTDGTAVGPGASAETAEKAITGMETDTDPEGAVFSKLTVRSPKQTRNSIKLKWKKISNATEYVVYGNRCGKYNKPTKLVTVSGNVRTFKKILSNKLKKGTYYKFIIVALDKDQRVVSTSKLIHVATKGGTVGNHKSVSVKKAVLNSAKAMKIGSRLKLRAKAVPQSSKLRVKKHVAVRYESTDEEIATVSKTGVIKARKTGTCYVYAYAQSGVYKRIKVVVK